MLFLGLDVLPCTPLLCVLSLPPGWGSLVISRVAYSVLPCWLALTSAVMPCAFAWSLSWGMAVSILA